MQRSQLKIAALFVGLLGLVLWTGKYLRRRAQFGLNATLVIAAQEHQTEVALRALRQGADPNARGSMAISQSPDELLYNTKEDPHLYPALILAAANGDAPLLEALLERGADVNAQTPEGYTALIYTAFTHQPQATDILLKHGAFTEYRT
ncbi:MAG: uncharacterized protein JWN14_3112 [Chthonomonadales bacterium]|nr:uncharacterized protein [Chthonomonadales bacterium]